jgi:phospholipid/cholesterol/gamma-HCH transport system substrate-binding protein
MKKKFSAARTWERIRTVPGLGRNVLMILILFVIGITSASFILSNQRFIPPWSDRYEFTADFGQVPSVNPGQQPKVRIAGVQVGQVTDSQVTDDGKARLTFSIEQGTPIYRNAHLVLRPTNPLNEMYVEIDPGGPPAEKLGPNGTIPASQTERPVQADEVLNHLDQRARSAVSNLLSSSDIALASAPKRLPEGFNATDATIRQFQPVLDSLQQRRANIARLVTAMSKISKAVGNNDGRLTDLMDSSDQAMGVLSQHDGEMDAALKELPGTTTQLRRAMTGVNGLTGELNPTLDNLRHASGQLPQALRRAGGTVDELGRTVRAARPVVSAAGPVMDDLRPMVNQANNAVGHLVPMSKDLQPDTGLLTSYIKDVQAFIYNTNGAFSLSDANGGFIRGHVAVPLPDGGVLPGSHGGNTGGSHP